MSYRVSVKTVLDSDGSLEKTVIYGFESLNDWLVGSIFDTSAGHWKALLSASERPVLKAVWENMKPYMEQKRIPYSNSWKWE